MLGELAVMKPAQQMGMVIQLVGGTQHLLKVTAVIARRLPRLDELTKLGAQDRALLVVFAYQAGLTRPG